MTDESRTFSSFRHIPYMGVIYVVAEAMKLGFRNLHPDWCNLGQGQPEVGEMKGAPPRCDHIDIQPEDHAYGHIGGTDEMCSTIAAHYNRLYRKGKASQYTAENVSVAAGGRLMLTRAFAALGDVNLGYQVPDYTAYEDMIQYHEYRFNPVLLLTEETDNFSVPPDRFEREVIQRGLGAYVFSNPCNPTGAVVKGEALAEYVRVCRERDCVLLADEFYSHFIYGKSGEPGDGPVSAAEHVEDVNEDPILIIDGLTKSFRYPGWRVGWAVGPKELIDILGRAASAIDGGPSRPIQRAAIEVLEPVRADQETNALRAVFSRKRNLMVSRLKEMGIRPSPETEATFYTWACIEDLPPPLNDGHALLHAALTKKVMTVPGVFFDVNPGRRRRAPSPLRTWTRFSFGPPEENVRMGLDRLEELIREHR